MNTAITTMLDLTPPNLLNQTSLAFRDARGCKDWLATLPLTDVPRAHTAMMEVVDSLNLTKLPGFERLKIMELLREKVAFLQDSMAEIYAGKPFPLSNRRLDIWEGAEALWQGMEQGYRYCLRAAANGDVETAKHFALIAERCLRYTGLQMLHHAFVYREVPEQLLRDLHALFYFAEKRGVAHLSVKDGMDGHRGITTAAQCYVRALLLDAARPSMLMPNELMAVDAMLKKWAAKVVISRIPPEESAAVLRCTDLAGKRGLWTPAEKPAEEEGTLIFLDLKELSDSLRRRIRKLASGTSWRELNLPSIFAQVPAAYLLGHVYRFWCEPASPETSLHPALEQCEVTGTFAAFYHCLAGKPFEAPRQSEELGPLEAQQMAVFGKVMNRVATQTGVEAKPTESWKLEGAGIDRLVFRRPTTSNISIGLQQLIGYRRPSKSGYEFGVVSSLTDYAVAGLGVEIASLPGRPEAVIFRAKDAGFMPAVRLQSADESVHPSLLLPTGSYQYGKVVEVRDNAIHMYRLTGLTQRSANFEWATYEPL